VSNSFEIGPVQVGGRRLFLIAGPCVIESEAHVRAMAETIQRITADLGVPYIFKASYDKANRTSVKSFRGPGLKEGIGILGRLARDTGLPVLTDVHEPGHCEIAAEFPHSCAARPICWWRRAAPDAPSISRRASSSPLGT
jgi:2-dehydro-3-deoxyphosphooctonate aldolase (KDO 8-P synthase)